MPTVCEKAIRVAHVIVMDFKNAACKAYVADVVGSIAIDCV